MGLLQAIIIAFLVPACFTKGEDVCPETLAIGQCPHPGFSGGYVIEPVEMPPAGWVSFHYCDDRAVAVLWEHVGRCDMGRHPLKTPRAFLTIEIADGERLESCMPHKSSLRNVLVLVRRPIADYDSPDVIRAWRANVNNWSFDQVDPDTLICSIRPPIDW